MNRVERAIIMAAGKGTRMLPITLKTPKPLVKINGIRMIDTVIQALHHNGIFEIYIVSGYLKEQFRVLENKYNVKILENPFYDSCNNISSLYIAREYIENSIILDGDQIIYNNQILSPEFEKSGYNAVWREEYTDEWMMQVNNRKVISCSREGGERGWQLYSISRWNKEDGRKLRKYLEIEFEEKNNRQIYWDDVVMFCYFEDFDLEIRPMQNNDVIEIDNLCELATLDATYKKYIEDQKNE